MSELEAAAAALRLPGGDTLARALAELMFRKGLITPAELDEVLADRSQREMGRERMWAGLVERAAMGGEQQ